MQILEAKDIKLFRPKGIKRYWIVTSVDAVAKEIKMHQKRLANHEVWTDDFTTMYTMLDHQRLTEGVGHAIKEAFEYQSERISRAPRVTLKWLPDGKCHASFSDDGAFELDDVLRWIPEVVGNTFIKQDSTTPTRHQRIGVPMGGKCSSELANLYCYAVESSAFDRMLANGEFDLVKSIYNTSRFIDDMLGFSPVPWDRFDYGMEHARTNPSPTEAVFLGMKIDTSGEFVKLSL